MPTDQWGRVIEKLRSQWHALERDWRSVAIGLAIVVVVSVFELRVPW